MDNVAAGLLCEDPDVAVFVLRGDWKALSFITSRGTFTRKLGRKSFNYATKVLLCVAYNQEP